MSPQLDDLLKPLAAIVVCLVLLGVLAVFHPWVAGGIALFLLLFVTLLRADKKRALDPRRRRPVPGDPEPLD